MWHEAFRIPFFDIPVYSYGLLMVIGFLAGTQVMKVLARRTGVDPDFFVNAALVALITGVIGARLSHVLENFHTYTDPSRSAWANFTDAINIRAGGLTYYGGFLLATPATMLYALWKKIPIRHLLDIGAPALMVGLAFGRIGCFANGCCYGAACDLPWAVHFPYYSNTYVDQFASGKLNPPPELLVETDRGPALAPPAQVDSDPLLRQIARQSDALGVHPAQLYSAFTAFFLAAVLVALFTLPHAQGTLFMVMLILEGSTRFVLELLRAEPAVAETAWGGMSISMLISLGLVVAGIIGWLALRNMKPDKRVLTFESLEDEKHHARGLALRA
jgi:phosphatidylglycerol:prolipoprotein diacylglycerol transferase